MSDTMTVHRPEKVCAVLLSGLLGVSAGGSARAADRRCAAIIVEADPRVRALWPELPVQVHQAFDARADIDTCAHVRLTMTDASIRLEVMLPDGRAASRSVWWRDVVPALAALLLVPDGGAPGQAPEADSDPDPDPDADHAPRRARPPVAVMVAPGDPAPWGGAALAPSDRPEPSHLRIEFSFVTGMRRGSGQTSVGVGALSLVDLGGWLFGFEGRFDRYQAIGPGGPGIALTLAPLAGRRFRFGTVALDFTAGPALALPGTTTFEMPAATPDGQPVRWTNATTAARLLLGARVNFRARSVLRSFVGLDADIGLSRERLMPPLEAPRLPDWSVGLVLGATVGTI